MPNAYFPSLIPTEDDIDAFDSCIDPQYFRALRAPGSDEAQRLAALVPNGFSIRIWARDFYPMIHDAWLFNTQGQL